MERQRNRNYAILFDVRLVENEEAKETIYTFMYNIKKKELYRGFYVFMYLFNFYSDTAHELGMDKRKFEIRLYEMDRK